MEGAIVGGIIGGAVTVISIAKDFQGSGFDTVGIDQIPSEFRTHIRNFLMFVGVVLGSAAAGAIIQSAIQNVPR